MATAAAAIATVTKPRFQIVALIALASPQPEQTPWDRVRARGLQAASPRRLFAMAPETGARAPWSVSLAKWTSRHRPARLPPARQSASPPRRALSPERLSPAARWRRIRFVETAPREP